MLSSETHPESDLILALDVGTLSVRAIVYDHAGHQIASSAESIRLNRINDVEIEQDPDEILNNLVKAMEQVLACSEIEGRQISVAGLSSQRSSVVCWNRVTGRSLSPVISWQDRRAFAYLEPLEKQAHKIKEISGLILSPHYGASKLRWLLDNSPSLSQEKDLIFGPLAAFIVTNLVEDHPRIVDHVNASRTQLMDLHKRNWSKKLLSDFELSADLLPECRPTQFRYGRLKNSQITLEAVNGDQNAAIHGAGQLEEGTFIVNIGTGAFVLLPTGDTPIHHPRLLASVANSDSDTATYLLEGTVNGAGAAIQWAAEEWDQPDLSQNLEQWLKEVETPPIFVNTIGGLGSPMWEEGPKPTFIPTLNGDGTTREGTTAEKAVAIVESIIFLIHINLDAITSTGQDVKRIRISGGLSSVDGLCQMLADMSQRLVIRSEIRQSTSRGIAWLAGKPAADWSDLEDDYFLPKQNRPLQNRYRTFCQALGWN
ncbi:MAG: glycerol kinase [Cellvibrionaceae bacterium]|jgi:glycerol kinase